LTFVDKGNRTYSEERSISADPFLQFRFPGKKGDVLKVTFLDNRNELFTAEAVVQ
jgi:sulfur-oxidizing protein SoxZ